MSDPLTPNEAAKVWGLAEWQREAFRLLAEIERLRELLRAVAVAVRGEGPDVESKLESLPSEIQWVDRQYRQLDETLASIQAALSNAGIWPDAEEGVLALVEQRDRYRVALEVIVGRDNENRRLWEGPVPRWTDRELALSGDPCYGNYDDAHSHGADYGMAQAADIARAVLSREKAPDAE